jgi:MFS family permease
MDAPTPWYRGIPAAAWVVFAVSWLGGLCDGLDTLLFSLVLRPAMGELLGTTDAGRISTAGAWVQAAFLVGWMGGGLAFGLVADRFGRVRAMIGSILTYAIMTGLCGLARAPWELAALRFATGLGVGGELVVVVTLVAETWPERARVQALGLLASSFQCGYLVASLVFARVMPHGWRWVFAAGAAPAVLTLLVRLTMKEPARWTAARARAAERGESARLGDLFAPALRGRTLAAAALCAAALVGFWVCTTWVPTWIQDLVHGPAIAEKSYATLLFSVAAIAATALAGTLAGRLGRRRALAAGLGASALTIAGMFLAVTRPGALLWASYAAVGFATGSVVSVLYIYLPELFPTRLRATGKGFVFNVGRLLTAAAVVASGLLIQALHGSFAAAGAAMALVWLAGLPALRFLPETRDAPLPD